MHYGPHYAFCAQSVFHHQHTTCHSHHSQSHITHSHHIAHLRAGTAGTALPLLWAPLVLLVGLDGERERSFESSRERVVAMHPQPPLHPLLAPHLLPVDPLSSHRRQLPVPRPKVAVTDGSVARARLRPAAHRRPKGDLGRTVLPSRARVVVPAVPVVLPPLVARRRQLVVPTARPSAVTALPQGHRPLATLATAVDHPPTVAAEAARTAHRFAALVATAPRLPVGHPLRAVKAPVVVMMGGRGRRRGRLGPRSRAHPGQVALLLSERVF
jgi:hypothetical protein